ncbi:MAG: hypothetical protein U5K54_04935 [Cytophagales bacterium]|nr:hypothetical protein [Cytophagales bacterium]
MKLTEERETKDKRTSIARYNIYDRRGYDSEYNMLLPIPLIGYNPDDKFIIGANFHYVKHGFKKYRTPPSKNLEQAILLEPKHLMWSIEGIFLV